MRKRERYVDTGFYHVETKGEQTEIGYDEAYAKCRGVDKVSKCEE